MRFSRSLSTCVLMLILGCDSGTIETTYGRSRGQSVNGINTITDLIRQRGHETRPALRLTPQLSEWADVIIRFTPDPGPLRSQEATWYTDWLNAKPGRQLVYVRNDYSAEVDYWDDLLNTTLTVGDQKRATQKRDQARALAAKNRVITTPTTPSKNAAGHENSPVDPTLWFKIEPGDGQQISQKLAGPWAEGVDVSKAALPYTSRFDLNEESSEQTLLSADGKPLAIDWSTSNGADILVIANGSFLVNGALLNKSRRLIATQVLDWIDQGGTTTNVATVEGLYITAAEPKAQGLFDIIQVHPFNWISLHLVVLSVLAALALAPRLGRARDPITSSDAERPAAHPEALGSLMSRSVPPDQARSILATYREWRNAPAGTRRPRSFD